MTDTNTLRLFVRPRTIVILMIVILLAAGAGVWYLLRLAPPGRVQLRDLSVEGTATVGLAGVFPSEDEPGLRNPLGIATDGQRVYVAESDAGQVRIYDSRGGHIGIIGIQPVAEAGTAYPSALALTDDGRLAIVDNAARRVVVVSTEPAEKAKVLLTLGGDNDRPGQPTAVAFAGGEFFVFDAAVSGVRVYDASGSLTRTIATNLEPALTFAGGMGIADGQLYVADSNAGRVVKIDAETGKQTLVFGDRFSLPRDIAPMGASAVAVVDAFERAVYITSDGGVRLDVIDATTVHDAPMDSPRAAVWVPETKRLYVTDASLGRVLVFNVALKSK